MVDGAPTSPRPAGRTGSQTAGGPDANGPQQSSWRVVLDKRALPLPVLRPITIGSDARNGIQLAHNSIRDFHARLVKRGDGIVVDELGGSGGLSVDGVLRSSAVLTGGEELRLGDIRLRVERGAVAPAVQTHVKAPPSVEQEFQALFIRELKRAPWFAISLAVHILLLLAAREFIELRPEEEFRAPVRAAVDDADDAMAFDDTESVPDTPPELPEPMALPDLEPVLLEIDDEPAAAHPVDLGVADFGSLRIGAGQGGGESGFGELQVDLGKISGPLKDYVSHGRERGLDVAFLIDTTASMDPFLDAAKRTVDDIITDLASLVPNMRLSVVAYRDQGDAYVTRSIPLSSDRYQILNFLQGLEARGGGDVPEAVFAALEHALDGLLWRPEARRVIVIVADAPPHPEEMARLRMRLKTETRSRNQPLTVSTIFTGGRDMIVSRQRDAETGLKAVAAAGDGEFSHLSNMSQVVTQIRAATFGRRFEKEIQRLLRERRESPRQQIVRKRVETGDVDWLLRKLKIVPIEPSVVAGLIQIDSPGVALRCFDLATDEGANRSTREAALYILRRITRYDGHIDLAARMDAQQAQVKDLRLAIESAFRR